MRWSCLVGLLAAVAAAPDVNARFSVDGTAVAPTIAVASIEPRNGAPGYSWLRAYFYSTPPTAGREETTWSAVLQFTLDKAGVVWQVDMSVPGHGCTIAGTDSQAKDVLQQFTFDGARLRLKSKGSHVCDFQALKIPNQTFAWDVDLDLPVTARGR